MSQILKSKTDHLGLKLTDASETSMTFLEWRTIMNGTDGTSNMDIIDRAVKDVDDKIDNLADNETIKEIRSTAVGVPEWNEASRELTFTNIDGESIGDPIVISGDGVVILSLTLSDKTLTLNRSPAEIFSLYENAEKIIFRFEYSGILIDLAVAAVDKTENELYLSSVWENRTYSVFLQEVNTGSMSGPLEIKDLASEDDLSDLETRIEALENLTNLDEVSF